MNIRQALAQSPVKQAIRDEGNGLRITVTRQASEYYEVVAAMEETVHFSETVVDEQAVALLLWERLRTSSFLFEPAQTLCSLVPVQASPSLSRIEQLATEHEFGTLLESHKERYPGVVFAWLSLILGIPLFALVGRLLLDDTVTSGGKMLTAFLLLPLSLVFLYGGYACMLDSIQINEILREIKDKPLRNYQIVLLYERGLICSKWIKRKGTWENDLIVLPLNAIGYLRSSASTVSQYSTVDTFTIKTKDGRTIDISFGGQAFMNAIERQMNATLASAT